MKTVKHLLKAHTGLIAILCLISLSFTSCMKDNDDDYVAPPAAYLSVINASPGSQPVDFFLDQNRGNAYPIGYGQGLDYIQARIGKRTAAFYAAGTQQLIKSDTTTLEADKFYTLYLTNAAATPDFVLLRDELTRPAAGMATIRLVNVSATAPAVDLAIKQGAVLVANKAYKGFSPFVPVQGNTYTLEIREAGTANVLLTLTDVKLSNNGVYTVWLQGVRAATDVTKLTALIQTNAFFQ
jgi:hypothetical protein